MYGLTVVTEPTAEPVTLDEAKAHLRVEFENDDLTIKALITAARKYCETVTKRALVTQTLRLTRDAFPGACEDWAFRLPRPPLQSVSSIKYATDEGRARTSIVSSSYSWTASGSGTNEYYLRTAGSADPGIDVQPSELYVNGTSATSGTLGALTAGQWGYGDNDSLGYDTIYVRLSGGGDPDSQSSGYIKYVAGLETVSTDVYYVDTTSLPGRVGLAYEQEWPTDVTTGIGAVQVNYVAGYGAASAVPETIKQAMLLLIGHWYTNREAVGPSMSAAPMAVDSLLTSEWSGELVGDFG